MCAAALCAVVSNPPPLCRRLALPISVRACVHVCVWRCGAVASQEEMVQRLVEGVLAANIFDWGSKECVRLYQTGTILDIYRMSRSRMKRPWRVRASAPLPPPPLPLPRSPAHVSPPAIYLCPWHLRTDPGYVTCPVCRGMASPGYMCRVVSHKPLPEAPALCRWMTLTRYVSAGIRPHTARRCCSWTTRGLTSCWGCCPLPGNSSSGAPR